MVLKGRKDPQVNEALKETRVMMATQVVQFKDLPEMRAFKVIKVNEESRALKETQETDTALRDQKAQKAQKDLKVNEEKMDRLDHWALKEIRVTMARKVMTELMVKMVLVEKRVSKGMMGDKVSRVMMEKMGTRVNKVFKVFKGLLDHGDLWDPQDLKVRRDLLETRARMVIKVTVGTLVKMEKRVSKALWVLRVLRDLSVSEAQQG